MNLMTELEEYKQDYEKLIAELRICNDRVKALESTIDNLKANLSRKDHDLNRLKGKLEGYEFCIEQFAGRN